MKILGGDVVSGFGMTGYSGIKFFLNGVFDHLDFTLALADDMLSRDEHVKVRFSVVVAPGWNRVASEEMEFGGNILFQCDLGPGEAPRPVSVDISDAGMLIFTAKSVPYADETGKCVFAVPHLAIARPRLHYGRIPANATK